MKYALCLYLHIVNFSYEVDNLWRIKQIFLHKIIILHIYSWIEQRQKGKGISKKKLLNR